MNTYYVASGNENIDEVLSVYKNSPSHSTMEEAIKEASTVHDLFGNARILRTKGNEVVEDIQYVPIDTTNVVSIDRTPYKYVIVYFGGESLKYDKLTELDSLAIDAGIMPPRSFAMCLKGAL